MQFLSRIFILVAIVMFFAANVLDDGNFSKTCKDIKFSGTMLSAKYENSKKVRVATTTSLNKCLANYNGRLACAPNFK